MCLLEIWEQRGCVVALKENLAPPMDQNGGDSTLWLGWILPKRTFSRGKVTKWKGETWEVWELRKEFWVTIQKSGLSHAKGTVNRGSQHKYLVRNPWKHQIRVGGPTLGILHTWQALQQNYMCRSFHEPYLSLFPLPSQPWKIQKQSSEWASRGKNTVEMSGRIQPHFTSLDAGIWIWRRPTLQGRESP